jgi:hypothetical protein
MQSRLSARAISLDGAPVDPGATAARHTHGQPRLLRLAGGRLLADPRDTPAVERIGPRRRAIASSARARSRP